MDESAFTPRERGFIELTPLIYRTVSSGSIKAGQKYIVYNSGSFDTDIKVQYPQSSGTFYTAKDAIAHADNFKDIPSGAEAPANRLAGGNWKKKIKQGDKIEHGVSYYVYGGGKVKYIAQIEASAPAVDEATSISVQAIPEAIERFTILEFSNGATFIVTNQYGASENATSLTGILSGDIENGEVAPIIQNKSNKKGRSQVFHNSNAGVLSGKSKDKEGLNG